LKNETLLAIKDYLKANGNGINPDYPIFKTLGKHGPLREKESYSKSGGLPCEIDGKEGSDL
jgi:hypothetical protein